MNGGLGDLRGRWFDTNGSTVVTIYTNSITFELGGYRISYPAALRTEGIFTMIHNPSGGHFGMVTALTVEDDGSLTGHEMVYDADGHTFHFLREERPGDEKEKTGASRDMP